MDKPRHSTTAEGVALARAAHQLIDARPPIFDDTLALRIIGAAGEERIRETRAMYDVDGMRRGRTSVLVRSRFVEEELGRSRVSQYVVLGAGLDTFAYRRTDLAERLTVFEVDEPHTQQWKRDCLAKAGIRLPENLRFAPVDFTEGTLADGLAAAGFRRDVATLFSWLGVVYYLPEPAIADTLRFIATQAAPAEVIFDFALPGSAIDPSFAGLVREFTRFNESRSERWRTWFTPQEVKSLLRECGFREIVHLDYATITRSYLAGRADGLLPSPLVELIAARTPGRKAGQ